MSSNSESTGGGSGSERSSGHLNAGMDVAEYGMQKEEKVWGMPGFYDEDEGSRKFGQVLEDGIKLITPDDVSMIKEVFFFCSDYIIDTHSGKITLARRSHSHTRNNRRTLIHHVPLASWDWRWSKRC